MATSDTQDVDARPSVVVSGTLALDVLGRYDGDFSASVSAGAQFSLAVQLADYQTQFGGCAMNIAYGLALLGIHPLPIALAGRDFTLGYQDHLTRHGVDAEGVVVDTRFEYGSRCIVLSDDAGQQVTAFYPGVAALGDQSLLPLAGALARQHGADWTVLAPDVAENMRRHQRSCAAQANVLLDPGQGLPDFTAMQTRELIAAARFLIVNAHEWQVLQQQLRSSPAEIASGLEWVIVTLGAQGAELWQGAQRRHFGAIPVAEVREHTGAGDAFRAGLIAALAYGQDIDVALRAAALSAHFKLGSPGTQQHRFTPAEFVSAWQHAYSEACPFSAALV